MWKQCYQSTSPFPGNISAVLDNIQSSILVLVLITKFQKGY